MPKLLLQQFTNFKSSFILEGRECFAMLLRINILHFAFFSSTILTSPPWSKSCYCIIEFCGGTPTLLKRTCPLHVLTHFFFPWVWNSSESLAKNNHMMETILVSNDQFHSQFHDVGIKSSLLSANLFCNISIHRVPLVAATTTWAGHVPSWCRVHFCRILNV